jgi:hypothetical protein
MGRSYPRRPAAGGALCESIPETWDTSRHCWRSDLLRATIADGMAAMAIILAMSFGVVAPKMILDRFSGGSTPLPES